MRIRWICLQVCLLLWSLGWISAARAEPEWIIGQPSDELRMTDLSFGATLDGGYGFGITPGLQMGIPLIDSGLIRPINDSFYLEPGLFMGVRLHSNADTDYWAIPEVGPRWNFHLTPHWDAFASLKLGWAIGKEGDFWVRGTIGMQWWFVRQWALRLESTAASIVGAGGYIGFSYRFM